MKNSKRMLAVIAASGLALGSLPGVANAQSDILDLDLGTDLLGGSVSIGLDLFVGSSGEAPTEFPTLAGSVEDIETGGSSELTTGSDDAGDILGEIAAGSTGSTGIGGSGSDFDELSSGSDSASDDLPSGSDSASDEAGSDSASDEAGSDSASDEAGSDSASDDLTDDLGGLSSDSIGSDSEGSSGSDDGGDTTDPSIFDQIGEWITDLFDGGSSDLGSSGENGGSSALSEGSSDNDIDLGSVVEGSSDSGSGAETVLALGSLAAGGIAIGLIVSGGVNLPALPGIDVAAVCNLPQEGIDFLKGAGSMEPQECLPEEQN